MNAITSLYLIYADGGAVGIIDDTSDWSSTFLAFDPYFFGFAYFYFFVGDLDGDFDPYFYLLFDFPDFADFYDLSPSPFFLLLESPAISNFLFKILL